MVIYMFMSDLYSVSAQCLPAMLIKDGEAH